MTNRTLRRAALALALTLAYAPLAKAAIQPDRMHVLSRGVNLISVFTDKPIARVLSDMRDIKRDGFRNVRILVDAAWVHRLGGKSTRLDQIVRTAARERLGVILCMISADHPMDDAATDETLEFWSQAWTKLARRYAKFDPSMVVFEIANEPSMDGARWANVQDRLLRAVRTVAPDNTVLLTASPTSMVWSLHSLPPSHEANVGYTVHLYQPMYFTHQSASWAGSPYMFIHGLEYPPDRGNVENLEQSTMKQAIPALQEYLHSGGTALTTELDVADAWAKAQHASVVVTEYGVYQAAPSASRLRWLTQARKGMESRGFGWDVWEYDGGFGVKSDLDRPGCQGAKQALGLCE